MKLDKKACRKLASAPLHISPTSGLLCAESIKHIVAARVTNIAGQRVLVVYFYPCEWVKAGNYLPRWTVFQGKHDYVTLERNKDGATRWRTSMVYYLGPYAWISQCVFRNEQEIHSIEKFCKAKGWGLYALESIQDKLRDQRIRKNAKTRNDKIRERMKCVPAIPQGLKYWLQHEIAPVYLFYDYKKGCKTTEVYCTNCGKTSVVSGAKHKKIGQCPHCKRTATFKSRGKRGWTYDRSTGVVLQKISNNEIVLRVFKYSQQFNHGDQPKTSYYEDSRIFCAVDANGQYTEEPYYESYCGKHLVPWRSGERPKPMNYYYANYDPSSCGYLYTANLKKELASTPWQYFPFMDFVSYLHAPLQVESVLQAYIRHPKIEQLIKVGFMELARHMIFGGFYNVHLDETQNRTHRLLRVAKEDVAFLRELNINCFYLDLFQKYSEQNLKDRQELIRWQVENKMERSLRFALRYMSAHKFMRYMQEQIVLHEQAVSKSWVCDIYSDYLRMCEQQHYDLKNDFVLFPKDCSKAHNKVQTQIRLEADEKRRKKFAQLYERVMKNLNFERKGLTIVFPKKPEDLITEGHTLHHCVGSYVNRVENKECLILFVRQTSEPDKPFYTMEVGNNGIAQVRGKGNCDPTPKVKKFVELWERRALQAPANKAA